MLPYQHQFRGTSTEMVPSTIYVQFIAFHCGFVFEPPTKSRKARVEGNLSKITVAMVQHLLTD